MSCWDCLRIFFPTSYQFTQPNYELEELVIVNNNNTTETTNLKSYIAQTRLSNPTKKFIISNSTSEIDEILEDQDEIIFERTQNSKSISPTRNTSIHHFQNLSDTEVFGNQKLKKRRKRYRMIKPQSKPTISTTKTVQVASHTLFSSTDTDESSWDDSLIIS